MTKSDLLSHIHRYHLSGMVEAVVWNVRNGVAQIKFVAAENSTAGEIIFPFIEVGDKLSPEEELGVFNTSSLVKLLAIMQEDIELTFEKEHGIWMKLNVTDKIYEGSFSLADVRRIPDSPEFEEPKVFEVSFPIDKEFKDQFIKAYKALGSINRFTIQSGKTIKFTLGNKESYANKVSFTMKSEDSLPLRSISFSGEAMAEILKNNPDLTESTVEVSDEGMMKITIYGGDDKVIYYLIELEEV